MGKWPSIGWSVVIVVIMATKKENPGIGTPTPGTKIITPEIFSKTSLLNGKNIFSLTNY